MRKKMVLLHLILWAFLLVYRGRNMEGYAAVYTTDGTLCVFPFTYGGVVYNSCTTTASTYVWCSTNSDYSGNWGYCWEPKCSGNTSACRPGGYCSGHGSGRYTCACNTGYEAPGKVTESNVAQLCQDIDECTEDTSVCGPNADCNNIGGSYSCTCHHGYRAPPGVTLTTNGSPCEDIDECTEDTSVCGPNADCSNTVGGYNCSCHHGYRAPPGVTLTNATHSCQDIDECTEDTSVCGPNADCSNTVGGYSCTCHHGYRAPPGITLTNATHSCQDIDECTEDTSVCGPNADCSNTVGGYNCSCHHGYRGPPGVTLTNTTHPCQDIDECTEDTSVCGPNADCSNTVGGYSCSCHHGYRAPPGVTLTNTTHSCQDIDECTEDTSVCGPNADCNNIGGSYSCCCHHGYRAPPGVTLTNTTHSCQDVDECKESATICGPNANCMNIISSYTCECDEGYIPVPGLDWVLGVSVCKDVKAAVAGPCQGLSGKSCYLENLNSLIEKNITSLLPSVTAITLMDEVSGTVESLSQTEQGEGLIEAGGTMLRSMDKLASTQVTPTSTQINSSLETKSIVLQTFSMGPKANLSQMPQLNASNNFIDIDLVGITKNNNGSGAVAFMTYASMGDVLKAELFHTENDTLKTMMSAVVAASLPKTKNTSLTKPVNFTLRHLTQVDPEGQLTCVYWNESRWIVDGCEATETNATHTVCTCVHLSTFALIMQTDKPPKANSLLKLINTIAVSVELLFLALAILTFTCCRWNPKINNTARLHLSICLFLAHLLFLLVQSFLHLIHPHKLVCAVLSGVLHFLFLSSFVWMYLEALQLFLLVRNLREVRIIQREGIHWGYLLVIGYGLPCLVVGVSAGLVPKGYGSDQCWLKTDKGFKWSFLGPVCYILTANVILFITIIGTLWSTLAGLNKEISQLRDTRVMVFKALVQFVILGGPWILGFFVNNNEMLHFLFLVSTSQQGTFIFLVHCALNKEVQEQYRRWWKILCCSRDASDSSLSSRTSMTVQSSTD